jgi:hypothetical protein
MFFLLVFRHLERWPSSLTSAFSHEYPLSSIVHMIEKCEATPIRTQSDETDLRQGIGYNLPLERNRPADCPPQSGRIYLQFENAKTYLCPYAKKDLRACRDELMDEVE